MYRSTPTTVGDLHAKRKCGVVSLSDDRLWQTREQINNTPHLFVYIRTIHNDTSDECHCYPCSLLKSPNFIVKDKS